MFDFVWIGFNLFPLIWDKTPFLDFPSNFFTVQIIDISLYSTSVDNEQNGGSRKRLQAYISNLAVRVITINYILLSCDSLKKKNVKHRCISAH